MQSVEFKSTKNILSEFIISKILKKIVAFTKFQNEKVLLG